jgi:hypothetical protein
MVKEMPRRTSTRATAFRSKADRFLAQQVGVLHAAFEEVIHNAQIRFFTHRAKR